MGLFSNIFRTVRAGIHKATDFGQQLHSGIGRALEVAKRIGNIAGNLPLIGPEISAGLPPIFGVIEGVRSGLGELINVGNKVGDVLEGVKLPMNPRDARIPEIGPV